mmetsp:Transcript_22636/g.29395  ORF Transcript_22636/g.29395 Transcript_22636/m.29395 type:complete len:556 (+) Transcript_22636:183-1850(+)
MDDFPPFPGCQPVFGIAPSDGNEKENDNGPVIKKSSSQIDLDEIFKHFLTSGNTEEIVLDDTYDSDFSNFDPTAITPPQLETSGGLEAALGLIGGPSSAAEDLKLQGTEGVRVPSPAPVQGASAPAEAAAVGPWASSVQTQQQQQPPQFPPAFQSGKMPISAKNQVLIEKNLIQYQSQQFGGQGPHAALAAQQGPAPAAKSPSSAAGSIVQARLSLGQKMGIRVKEEQARPQQLAANAGAQNSNLPPAAVSLQPSDPLLGGSRTLMPMVRDAAQRPPQTISARVGFIKEDPEPMRNVAQMNKRLKSGVSVVSDDENGDDERPESDAHKIQRRERNREHAKRSRLRKKFLLDALQQSVFAIESENKKLKEEIVRELGQGGRAALQRLPSAMMAPQGLITSNSMYGRGPPKQLDNPDYTLVKALQTAQQNFVITDPLLPDNPIVFASNGFLTLTGYTLDQVLGRNCRFLQGPETDPRAIEKIRQAVNCGYDSSVCLLNYRKNGSPFWNQFFIAALRDGEGQIVNYVGVQCKVSDVYAQEVMESQYSDDEAPPMPKTS